MLVGAFLIVNTFQMLVAQRTRELGLLRAIGLSRRSLRRMIRLESVLIALFGAVLGLGLGMGWGISAQRLLGTAGLDVLSIPWATIVIVFAGAGVVGLLAEDAEHRDFTFNALFYDVVEHALFDPSRRGLADLLGSERRFQPLNTTDDPFQLAQIIARTMKFALRWEEGHKLDLEPVHAWIRDLPPGLPSALTSMNWDSLGRMVREIPASAQRKREFAAQLAPVGRAVLEPLLGGDR